MVVNGFNESKHKISYDVYRRSFGNHTYNSNDRFCRRSSESRVLGTVTSLRATTEGDIREHSSDQDEPRQGIGRLADHPSESGTFLASIDGIDETHCP